jgi:hypothetical protein
LSGSFGGGDGRRRRQAKAREDGACLEEEEEAADAGGVVVVVGHDLVVAPPPFPSVARFLSPLLAPVALRLLEVRNGGFTPRQQGRITDQSAKQSQSRGA